MLIMIAVLCQHFPCHHLNIPVWNGCDNGYWEKSDGETLLLNGFTSRT